MLVTGKRLRNLVASSTIDINLKGRNIERVTDFKLLGVTLDHDLSFNRQIEELFKKLAKRIGLLRHISPYFKRSRRDIYYSRVITPIIFTAVRFPVSSKRAARIILDAKRKTPSVTFLSVLLLSNVTLIK